MITYQLPLTRGALGAGVKKPPLVKGRCRAKRGGEVLPAVTIRPYSQRIIRVPVISFFDRGAAGDAAQGVVAEAAAVMAARHDAAELADHRLPVDLPRKLAVSTVSVDLLSKQHGIAAFLSYMPPLYTTLPQNAMVLFAKIQQQHRREQQHDRPRRLCHSAGSQSRRAPPPDLRQRREQQRQRGGDGPLQHLAARQMPPLQPRVRRGGPALRENAEPAERQQERRDAQLPDRRERTCPQRRAPGR